MDPSDDGPTGEPDGRGVPRHSTDVPVSLLLLGTIDAMEYEAVVDVEDAAAARRRVFEAGSDREAVEVLQELSAELGELERARLEELEGLVTGRLDPEAFERGEE